MSLVRPLLNAWLRYVEKPSLARAQDPAKLDRSIERKARLFLRGPRGARYERTELNGIPALRVCGPGVDPEAAPLIFYTHGGAYMFGSPDTHKAMVAHLSERAGMAAILPEYRKAPDHPWPAAHEDVLSAYDAVQDDPRGIIIGGDSAGGGLALGLTLAIAQQRMTRPLGTFCFSPLTDMRFSTPSITRNAEREVFLPASMIPMMTEMVLQGHPADDPRISPLLGDFTGCAPVWICVGDTEILLDNSVLMAERLGAQGVDVSLTVEHDLPHVWPFFHKVLPEGRATLNQLARWLKACPKN